MAEMSKPEPVSDKEVDANQKADPKQTTDTNPPLDKPKQTTPPKKSNKGCCILGSIVGVFIIFSTIRSLGIGIGPWSNSSYNPNIVVPRSEVANTTATPAAETKPASDNKKKTSTPSKTVEVTPPANANTVKPPADPPVTPAQPQASGPQTTFTKQEEIDYFIKEAITDEKYNFQAFPLHKWTKSDIRVIYAAHTPIPENKACADETISIINSLTNNINLTKTEDINNFDIAINFKPLSEINQSGHPLGYMYYDLNADNSFKRAYAIVPSDNVNGVSCHTIRHEMTHTIGLLHNLSVLQGGYHYSIFNVPVVGWSDYINIDKDLIKMMYNTGIRPGILEAEARAFLANATW